MEDSSSGSPSQQTQDIQISHYTLVLQPRFVILSRISKAVIDLVSFTRASALSFLHRRESTNVLGSYIPICILYPRHLVSETTGHKGCFVLSSRFLYRHLVT